jgi:hypothetical protein
MKVILQDRPPGEAIHCSIGGVRPPGTSIEQESTARARHLFLVPPPIPFLIAINNRGRNSRRKQPRGHLRLHQHPTSAWGSHYRHHGVFLRRPLYRAGGKMIDRFGRARLSPLGAKRELDCSPRSVSTIKSQFAHTTYPSVSHHGAYSWAAFRGKARGNRRDVAQRFADVLRYPHSASYPLDPGRHSETCPQGRRP